MTSPVKTILRNPFLSSGLGTRGFHLELFRTWISLIRFPAIFDASISQIYLGFIPKSLFNPLNIFSIRCASLKINDMFEIFTSKSTGATIVPPDLKADQFAINCIFLMLLGNSQLLSLVSLLNVYIAY